MAACHPGTAGSPPSLFPPEGERKGNTEKGVAGQSRGKMCPRPVGKSNPGGLLSLAVTFLLA